ncbi:hypothetical protein [Bradyrhizobium cenepequi]|uniref:hypothetical protein n=1 Tax=Bradyrhizobium cenepequi TaxID=2821403 RepID=UPI001CE2B94D|nr:hypothetical protein [Bradyrhizobium cenepequi]MCA6110983.1 hypothetical protein [Bradyrhizobium cenepequi]
MKRHVRQFAYQGIPSHGIGAAAEPTAAADRRRTPAGAATGGRADAIETKVWPLYFLAGEYDFL